MRKFLLAAIALGAMTSLAWAEPLAPTAGKAGPVEMSDSQLDETTAAGYVRKQNCCGGGVKHRGFKGGGFKKNIAHVNQYSNSYNYNASAAIGLCAHCGVTSHVSQYSAANNYSSINQGSPGFGF